MNKTIRIELPNFCKEDCPAFELEQGRSELDYFGLKGPTEQLVAISYKCKHEGLCNLIHNGEAVRT